MAKKPLPSPEELRQLLRYEPENGKLYWRAVPDAATKRDRCWNGKYAGKEALIADNGNGYRCGRMQGYRKTYAHRVAWTIFHGKWPEAEIDHINGDRGDNRIANLRLASRSENAMNTRMHKDGQSGLKGVFWCNQKAKWAARIRHDGRVRHLGFYTEKTDAAAAYRTASIRLAGVFARYSE